MAVVQNIVVDMSTRGLNPVAYSHQNDEWRTFHFEMLNNGEPVDMEGWSCRVGAILPGNEGGYRVIAGDDMDIASINDNIVSATLGPPYTDKAGNGILTLIFTTDTGHTIRPINIDFRIQESADGEDVVAGASDFVPVLEQYMSESMAQYIDAWLDEHPEATTTVQDESLTYNKLVPGTLGFVTPEMFGAVGDGVTDDTAAINAAIESGSKRIEFTNTTYLVSKMPANSAYPDNDQPCVSVYDKNGLVLNGNGAKLKCNVHGQGIIEINNSKNVTISGLELSGHGSFPPISSNGRGEKGDAAGGYYKSGYDWESHKNNSVDTSAFTGVNGNSSTPWGTFGGGYIGNAASGLLIENGCENINVYDVVSHGFNYSGICIGFRGHENYPTNKNISINNCTCFNMYDNGINVFLSNNVNIDNNKIYDIGHPDARPQNSASTSAYTYNDPGYGITLRKPNNESSKAQNTTITNNFISKCVRKGVDSHSSDKTVIDGNIISLCYVAGIENSNSTSAETWSTNMEIVNNVLTWCGAYGNAIGIITVTDGSATTAPTNYPYNIDISNNTLKECSCANNGIIYVRCGQGINVHNNIISGRWSIRSLSSYYAVR